VAATSDDRSDRAAHLNDLGNKLKTWFERENWTHHSDAAPSLDGEAQLIKGQEHSFDAPASPMYIRELQVESVQELDYSKDDAKDIKPPFSYATMIAQAIFSSDEEKLTLNNICGWIRDEYDFYRHSNSGWQVCHSCSNILTKC
jgi:hypothetical protein